MMKIIILKNDYVGICKFKAHCNVEDCDEYFDNEDGESVLTSEEYILKKGVCYCCSDDTGEVFRIKNYDGSEMSIDDAKGNVDNWECNGRRRFVKDVYNESAEGYPDSYRHRSGSDSWYSDGRYEFYIEQDETINWDDSKYNDVFEIIKSNDDKIEIDTTRYLLPVEAL